MIFTIILGTLTLFSVVLLLWQLIVGMHFPLHRRIDDPSLPKAGASFSDPSAFSSNSIPRAEDDPLPPDVTLLKPLKGCDMHTADSLRSWFEQEYSGDVQILFGVADADDPVCEVVRALLREFPTIDAELIICPEQPGPNAKVSTLIQLDRVARRGRYPVAVLENDQAPAPVASRSQYESAVDGDDSRSVLVISDADVRVPPDFLRNAVMPLRDPTVGLVNCFYQLANPTTLAMHWEAIAINADFWSQVLKSTTMKPQNFALGAVMITTREHLDLIGGFESLVDYLADDYQFGNRIAGIGARIRLCPVVVECWEAPMNLRQVWSHQLRWARTIRASKPMPYFFSILGNLTFWATLLVLFGDAGGFPLLPNPLQEVPLPWTLGAIRPPPVPWVLVIFVVCLSLRAAVADVLQARLTRHRGASRYWWLTFAKDYLQFGIWLAAFAGDTVTWRGRKFRVQPDGRLRLL